MQKQTQNRLTRNMVPLALSLLLTISATATAGALNASKQASQHKHEVVQAKPAETKPAESKPADKKDADKKDAAAKGDKEKPKVLSPAELDAIIATAQKVEPLDLLKDSSMYLNKKVTFVGTFNRFADIALDYKKAFRDSRDYVTFFILRPDVKEHTIPLAEMKLFFPRKQSDEVMDLESGDKIQIVGTQFSNALEEPWIDVDHIKILEKIPRTDKKKESPEF
jgi:hypothetical protein